MQFRNSRTIDPAIRSQDIDDRQIVTLTDFEIEFVVRRRDFQHAGAEFRIDRLIGDDRNLRAIKRSPDLFSDKASETLVVWVHCDADVGHDCFRTRRRDFDEAPRLVDDFVAHVIQSSFLRFRDDFLVGERGLRGRVPIDHALAAIDQSVVVKIDENFVHGARVFFIEGVALARPIGRNSRAV